MPCAFSAEGVSIAYDYDDTAGHENYRATFPFTDTAKQVAYRLSCDAIHAAEAKTRRGMSQQ